MKPISFIIITYNRPDNAIELLKNIVELEKAEELLEEVILVNNASTCDYESVTKFIAQTRKIPIRYFNSHENLGVAKGRNYAIEKSVAPILLMLDDDAVLQKKDSLTQLLKEFNTTNTTRPKAIISFKVLYYDTLRLQENALPHKKFNKYKNKSFFETYYYAGGAHAVKRSVLEKVGTYPEDFFYGMEEYDLSYRVLEAGYSIVYTNKISMLHKESPLGRSPKKDKLMMMWINKSRVSHRYLPPLYFYTTAFLWSLHYLVKSCYDIKGFIVGWKKIVHITKNEEKRTITFATLVYLKNLKARLWY